MIDPQIDKNDISLDEVKNKAESLLNGLKLKNQICVRKVDDAYQVENGIVDALSIILAKFKGMDLETLGVHVLPVETSEEIELKQSIYGYGKQELMEAATKQEWDLLRFGLIQA